MIIMKIENSNTLNHQGVLALRNAVVEQAAKDYIKHYNLDGNQSSFILTLEKWFRSDKFSDLDTEHSGEWFIKNLRELVSAGVRKINNGCPKTITND